MTASLPEGVTAAQVLILRPEDVLVVSMSEPGTQARVDRLREDIQRIFGHGQICILGPGISLSVVRQEHPGGAEVAAELRSMMQDLAP